MTFGGSSAGGSTGAPGAAGRVIFGGSGAGGTAAALSGGVAFVWGVGTAEPRLSSPRRGAEAERARLPAPTPRSRWPLAAQAP